MAKREGKAELVEVKALLGSDPDYLRTMVQSIVQAALEAEMTDFLGASRSERTGERRGYRSGYYERRLITRVGTLELRIPQDRAGEFSTEVFERYQRSEKALTAALFEMYVQGVSTRKVKAITEELCGHGFSASTVSAIVRKLEDSLAEFARRRLEQPFPYLIVDARYEKVREGGSVGSQAVLVAVAVDGRRQIIGVELAGVPERSAGARAARRRVRGVGRSRRPEEGDPGGVSGGGVAAVLRSLCRRWDYADRREQTGPGGGVCSDGVGIITTL